MHFIVTADKNWAIGRKGNTFVSIPENEQLLRSDTKGKAIIMSKYVADRFPGGLTYVDRVNIVLTRDVNYKRKGVVAVHSIEELLKEVDRYPMEDVYVIGGESIFKQLFPYAQTIDVTYIDFKYEADAYFENLDKNEAFELIEESEEKTYFDLEYVFRRYERKKQN